MILDAYNTHQKPVLLDSNQRAKGTKPPDIFIAGTLAERIVHYMLSYSVLF